MRNDKAIPSKTFISKVRQINAYCLTCYPSVFPSAHAGLNLNWFKKILPGSYCILHGTLK